MKKLFIASLFTFASITSTQLMAHDLKPHMKQIASNFTSFNKATTTQEAITALTQMKQAVNASKAILPHHIENLPSTDAKVRQYYALYNQMDAHINHAIALAKAGNLAEAKKVATQLGAIKDQGHRIYKVY